MSGRTDALTTQGPSSDPRYWELLSIADAIESVFAEHADLLRAIAATLDSEAPR